MVLSGTVTNVQRDIAQWDMPIAQYCMGHPRRPLSTRVVIPDDSKRWRNGRKPTPYNLQVVTAGGVVVGADALTTHQGTGESTAISPQTKLTVAMDMIAFLGRSAQSIIPSSTPSRKTHVFPFIVSLLISMFC